jgi:hypothetical protein
MLDRLRELARRAAFAGSVMLTTMAAIVAVASVEARAQTQFTTHAGIESEFISPVGSVMNQGCVLDAGLDATDKNMHFSVSEMYGASVQNPDGSSLEWNETGMSAKWHTDPASLGLGAVSFEAGESYWHFSQNGQMHLLDIFATSVSGKYEGPVDLSAELYLSWTSSPAAYIGLSKEFTLVNDREFKLGVMAEDGRCVAGMFRVGGVQNFSSVTGVGWTLLLKPLGVGITQEYVYRGGNGEVDITFSYASN